MDSWGWRIPFIIGGVLGILVLFLRRGMHETEAFSSQTPEARPPIFRAVRAQWRPALKVIGLGVGGTVCYYLWSVSAVQQAVILHGMSQRTALTASVLANLLLVISLPFWGRFSDRFGRRAGLMIGTGIPAIIYVPLQGMVSSDFLSLFIPSAVILMIMGATLAITPVVFAEMFPTRVRTIGVAVPYAVAVSLFGGTAPYLQTYFAEVSDFPVFTIYVVLLLILSTSVAYRLTETRGKDLTGEH